jgi:hypothetical protein
MIEWLKCQIIEWLNLKSKISCRFAYIKKKIEEMALKKIEEILGDKAESLLNHKCNVV